MSALYRVATDEEVKAANIDECYDLLVGPNGFECFLGEPEDRRWYRDGAKVVEELNRLAARVAALEDGILVQLNIMAQAGDETPTPLDSLVRNRTYCHECSKAGGADRAVYHLPPICQTVGA